MRPKRVYRHYCAIFWQVTVVFEQHLIGVIGWAVDHDPRIRMFIRGHVKFGKVLFSPLRGKRSFAQQSKKKTILYDFRVNMDPSEMESQNRKKSNKKQNLQKINNNKQHISSQVGARWTYLYLWNQPPGPGAWLSSRKCPPWGRRAPPRRVRWSPIRAGTPTEGWSSVGKEVR